MKFIFKTVTLIIFLIGATSSFAQSELKFANFKKFETTNGKVIDDLKVGYRTVGKLNTKKSNAILWPTWFTGTSEQIINFGVLNNIVDVKDKFIVIVDALGNGVSSSASNKEGFPQISIKDMVNSQHRLLTEHLGIKKLNAVIGVSMGAMQTFEWMVSYPDFMKKAITIIGTPKQSFYDTLFWQMQVDLLANAKDDKKQLEFAKKRVMDIFTLNLSTAEFLNENVKLENKDKYMSEQHSKMNHHLDYISQAKAMINHDIYKNIDKSKTIKDVVKAKLLVVVNKNDHTVNPNNAIDLANKLNSKKLVLDTKNGHMTVFFDHKEIRNAVVQFLKK